MSYSGTNKVELYFSLLGEKITEYLKSQGASDVTGLEIEHIANNVSGLPQWKMAYYSYEYLYNGKYKISRGEVIFKGVFCGEYPHHKIEDFEVKGA